MELEYENSVLKSSGPEQWLIVIIIGGERHNKKGRRRTDKKFIISKKEVVIAIIISTNNRFITYYIKLKKIYFHKNTISITANTSVLIVIVYHLISSTSSDVW